MRLRAIALREDIRARQQAAQVSRPCSLLSSTKLVSLPRPVSMVSQGIDGRSGPEISSTSAPCAASVRPATGPAITRDRSSTRSPASGRSPRRARVWARLRRSFRSRPAAVRPVPWHGARQPFLARAHHRDHAAGGIGCGLERLGVPLHQRGLDVVALGLAVQHLADGVAVMPEIGMQPHEARIAGPIDPGDGVPCRRRRLAVDAKIALAAAFDDGMPHIDRDTLRLPAAHLPDLRGSHSGRGIDACAAAAIRNDDGNCGSSPLSVTSLSAEASPPASVQISARISRGLCMRTSRFFSGPHTRALTRVPRPQI